MPELSFEKLHEIWDVLDQIGDGAPDASWTQKSALRLAGEIGHILDDEPADEEPERDEPTAWQRYDLTTLPDGTIEGRAATNVDNDDGYPDGIWSVRFRDREDMLKRTGGTHVGCSGVRVTVYLDGKLID